MECIYFACDKKTNLGEGLGAECYEQHMFTQNSYIESLIPSKAVFGDRISRKY